MTDTSFQFSASGFWFLLLIPLLLLVAWWTYRHTVPELHGTVKWLLVGLRSLLLLLITSLLLNPLLNLTQEKVHPPRGAVLVDASLSMQFPQAKQDSLRDWVQRLSRLPQLELDWYSFGDSLRRIATESTGDTSLFREPVTDMNQAIRSLAEMYREENLQAVYLISDGQYNEGASPLRSVRQLSVPVFTAGIGDTIRPRDAVLDEFLVPRVAYEGDSVTVEIGVRAENLAGRQAEMRLYLESELVVREAVHLPEDGFNRPLTLSFTPKQAGRFKLSAELVSPEEEITTLNNRASQFIEVLSGRKLVRVVCGRPSFDSQFLIRALEQDPHLDVEVWCESGTFQPPVTVTSADLWLLVDYPLSGSDPGLLQQIAHHLKSDPDWWIPAPDVLPLPGRSLPEASEKPLTVVPYPASLHPLLGESIDLEQIRARWMDLPPVDWVWSQLPAAVGEPLLVDRRTRHYPLFTLQDQRDQRNATLWIRDFWKWHLIMQNLEPGHRLMQDWVVQTVRWLTTRPERKQFIVSTSREIYPGNLPVEFNASLYDASEQPLPGAQVTVTVQSDTIRREYYLQDRGEGLYSGSPGVLPLGTYEYHASAVKGSYTLPEVQGKFAVEAWSREYATPVLNEPLLRQVAAITGGDYLNEAFPDTLTFYDRVTHSHDEYELRNQWLLLVVIIIGLSVEWFLRKYFHLL